MSLNTATLQAFSASLLRLSHVARVAQPHRLVHDALLALRPLVAFRSAWWGECSDSAQDSPPRNWLHGRINLSATFAQEWNRLAASDAFARESMRQLGTVIRSSGHDDPDPAVAAFSSRHALDHVMALTVELPGSGLMFFVALYRADEQGAFSTDEGSVLQEFFRHLLDHWQARVQDILIGATAQPSDAFALADAHGELLYLGGRMGRLLHAAYPQWSGSMLPPELAALLKGAPGTIALGQHHLTMTPCGELLALSLERKGKATGLPPRERSVAMLYAQGRSYKEIARLLELSPATVRTYLRNAYLHLGVRNKVELGSALQPGRRSGR